MRVSIFFICCLFCCCETNPVVEPIAKFSEGLFVCNEGVYGQTSGTVSFYNPTTKIVQNDLFRTINNRELGNVLQSMTIYNNKMFMVVNNSNKIEVTDLELKELAQINGLQQPRYLLPIDNNRAYVSQWGANGLTGSVAVIDLNNMTVSSTIPLYKGSERMFNYNGKIWVTHTGGYDIDHKIAILNPLTNSLDTTINVSDNVHSLQIDQNNRIWVACGGKTVYSNYPQLDTVLSTASALYCFEGYNLILQINFPKQSQLNHLHTNSAKNRLYYTYNNQVFYYNINTNISTAVLNGSFYGIGIIEEELYAARNSGINPSVVIRTNLEGVVIDSFTVGQFANSFYK